MSEEDYEAWAFPNRERCALSTRRCLSWDRNKSISGRCGPFTVARGKAHSRSLGFA